MNHITVTRKHEVHIGHRVANHESCCARMHGHGYVFEFTCQAEQLDTVGRVIDFSVIKSTLCQWLEDNWDHRFLVWNQDPFANMLTVAYGGDDLQDAQNDRIFVESFVRVPFNPTAENMAAFIVNTIAPVILPAGIKLTKLVLHETGKCCATVEAA